MYLFDDISAVFPLEPEPYDRTASPFGGMHPHCLSVYGFGKHQNLPLPLYPPTPVITLKLLRRIFLTIIDVVLQYRPIPIQDTLYLLFRTFTWCLYNQFGDFLRLTEIHPSPAERH